VNTATANRGFLRELPGWAVRGLFCALPSAVWAVLAGYHLPHHFTAMALGVALYVLGYAWLSAHPGWGNSPWVRAMGWAAWLKIALCVLGVVAWMGLVPFSRAVGGSGIWQAVMAAPIYLSTLGVDLFSGVAAINAGNYLIMSKSVAAADPIMEGAKAGFAVTLATTLVQGAFVSLQLAVLALVVRSWWWWRRGNSFTLAATTNRG